MKYQLTDLWFTIDGDYLVGESGDIKLTTDSNDPSMDVKQFLIHRIIGEKNAWLFHPDITAGIDRFLGKAIDQDLLTKMASQVKRALTIDSAVGQETLEVRCLDLGQGAVIILIWIKKYSDKPFFSMAVDMQTGFITQIK